MTSSLSVFLLALALPSGLLSHQFGSSSSRAGIYGFHESHGLHLPRLLSGLSTGMDTESSVAQVREKYVMICGRTQG